MVSQVEDPLYFHESYLFIIKRVPIVKINGKRIFSMDFSSYPLHWYGPSRLTARGLRPLSKYNIWLPEKISLACNWLVDKQADTFADISQKLWQPSPL